MNHKIGRNDPCSCGSGKKYKQCCMLKKAPGQKRKITATWINAPKPPAMPDLMDRTYGSTVASSDKIFHPVKDVPAEGESQ